MDHRSNITEYKMDYKRRGKAVIFCHEKFDERLQFNRRKGAEFDAARLDEAFKYLGFEVELHHDLLLDTIKDKLKKISEEDHCDADCLAVVVMSHGGSSKIYARDQSYDGKELWEPFIGNQYCSLNNKPKLFFVNVCRGSEIDKGVYALANQRETRENAIPEGFQIIPSTKDLLIARSCYEGFVSYRNSQSGSPFIQALCHVLEESGTEYHLLELLTAVNHIIARYPEDVDDGLNHTYQTFDARELDTDDMNRRKQMPNFFSTLTGLVYFRPKPLPQSVEINPTLS